MKFIKVIFLLLIALILALIVLYFFSGSLLKNGIQRSAPSLLGVPVTLESTAVDPLRGSVEIHQMKIANPSTFSSEYAFQLETFRFRFDPRTLVGESIHIHEIVIDGASILSDGLRADNHRAILKHLESKIPSRAPSESTEPEPEGNGKKVIIDQFAFTGSELVVELDGELITRVDFPDLMLQQIGSKGNAVTIAEALAQIYEAIASETTRVLTINQDVIENIGRAKLKAFGIDDVEDLKNPETLLKDPEKLGNILDALATPKPSSGGG